MVGLIALGRVDLSQANHQLKIGSKRRHNEIVCIPNSDDPCPERPCLGEIKVMRITRFEFEPRHAIVLSINARALDRGEAEAYRICGLHARLVGLAAMDVMQA
jgi:hypothetical protein